MPFPTESAKELLFGGAVGLCAGLAAKRFGVAIVGGVASAVFLLFRGVVFDGAIRLSWFLPSFSWFRLSWFLPSF
jgi:hypothetical protein